VVVVEVAVVRVRAVVVWVGVEVEEVEVKGSALAVLGAGVGVAVEVMGWAGHSWCLQQGAACIAKQRLAVSGLSCSGKDPWMRHLTTSKSPAYNPELVCSHQMLIEASRRWEVTARRPGKLRPLTILRPRPGGPFNLALSGLRNSVAGQLGSRESISLQHVTKEEGGTQYCQGISWSKA
jgi:hypothetical protein